MNKSIKITSEIRDPNLLLNKFIMFRYKNGSLSMYYVYKICKSTTFSCYNIFFSNGKIYYSESCNLNSYVINSIIYKILSSPQDYNMYIL